MKVVLLLLTDIDSTNGTAKPTPAAPDSAAFQNAVSGGLLGAAIAGGIALVSPPATLYDQTRELTDHPQVL
ncbi:hypothetical protein EX30DRAFT_343265 [Ascodesmis nigricans]|uniref:Uncharacterized protein n=1 Tax=Ascodesmis nigricans TaxID=341454 RepID=A0A4S2MMV6_9PEZI|nr:hypothetical protein EX30DRAFT_343265 [Ascodesmis nigricans]